MPAPKDNYPIILVLLLSSCVASVPTSSLSPGMTHDEVLSVMGEPAEATFFNNAQAWQYCAGVTSYEFATIYFYNDKVVSLTKTRSPAHRINCRRR